MIVHNFYIGTIPVLPAKTDAPLLIDTDAVLPFAMPFQDVEAVAWRDQQIVKYRGVVQHAQLAPGDLLYRDRQLARHRSASDQRRRLVVKIENHQAL